MGGAIDYPESPLGVPCGGEVKLNKLAVSNSGLDLENIKDLYISLPFFRWFGTTFVFAFPLEFL